MDINAVALSCRVASDLEERHTNAGTPVSNFRVAFDTGYGDNKRANFIEVALFGKLAELASQMIQKGQMLFLSGHLQVDEWEKDGKRVFKTKIICGAFRLPPRESKTGYNDPVKPDEYNRPVKPPQDTMLAQNDDDIPF